MEYLMYLYNNHIHESVTCPLGVKTVTEEEYHHMDITKQVESNPKGYSKSYLQLPSYYYNVHCWT